MLTEIADCEKLLSLKGSGICKNLIMISVKCLKNTVNDHRFFFS